MGRLFRLLVVAAIAWTAWHAGMAAWNQFRFSDEVEKIAQFGPDKDSASVLDGGPRRPRRATTCRSPRRMSACASRIGRPSVYIDVSYTVNIEILPRFRYPWTFTTSAHGWFVPGGRAPLK